MHSIGVEGVQAASSEARPNVAGCERGVPCGTVQVYKVLFLDRSNTASL